MSAYDVFEGRVEVYRVEVSLFNSVKGGKPIKGWTGSDSRTQRLVRLCVVMGMEDWSLRSKLKI